MEKIHDKVFYIVPNALKMKILASLQSTNQIYDITFYTLEEFLSHFLFTIKDEALLYLLTKENENIDVLKSMLKTLKYISQEEVYQSSKLQKLQAILKDLKANNYLEYDETFKDYLKTKDIYLMGYYLLDKTILTKLKPLNIHYVDIPSTYKLETVYEYDTLKDEVINTALKIRELNRQKISYNKIFIAGITDEYEYVLATVFKMFDIPLNYQVKKPLITMLGVKDYLKTKDLSKIKDQKLKKYLLHIEENLIYAVNSPYYDLLLKDKLTTTNYQNDALIEAVTCLNDALEIPYLIADDEYLFVLGFNQNTIPKIYKDEDYLSDNLKTILGVNQSYINNDFEKKNLLSCLTNIKNLTISYKLTTLSSEMVKSSLLDDLNLKVIKEQVKNYHFSNFYNEYLLTESLDNYYKYHEKSSDFAYLTTNISLEKYNSYHHHFTGLKREVTPYNLSYSSFDDFSKCSFKYYLKYILNLDEYKEEFSQKVGNIFHDVLKKSYNENFNFDQAFNNTISNIDLDSREKFLLTRLKDELAFIINYNHETEKKGMLHNFYGEKKLEVKLSDKVTLKGFIDKILYQTNNNITYYTIFDYKTGKVSLNLKYLNYGLFMQLPLYVFLITKSALFTNGYLIGFFYQKLLESAVNDEERQKNLKLEGYVINDLDLVTFIDEDFKNQSFIKGLGTTKDDNFKKTSKILSKEEINNLIITVSQTLKEGITKIDNSDFQINPKLLNNQNISCPFCPFNDICFKDYNDYIYIEGGENNA